MFNNIIVKLLFNAIYLFVSLYNMFIVFSTYTCILEFYFLSVCTFMAMGNTRLMLLSLN